MDVFAAVLFGVAPHPVSNLVGQAAPPFAKNQIIDRASVGHQQLQQGGEVRRVPVACNETFCKTDVARTHGRREDLPIMNADAGLRAAQQVAKTQQTLIGQFNPQPAHAQGPEHAQGAPRRQRRVFCQGGRRGLLSRGQGRHGSKKSGGKQKGFTGHHGWRTVKGVGVYAQKAHA